ncbi:MAG: RimK family protein [Gammaproteobacteria bacterium]|nr:RimK family protein [Gammaproteobacteria bacterium]MDH5727685.1 RimK family protein [Gammaproteobacteria bacterium]
MVTQIIVTEDVKKQEFKHVDCPVVDIDEYLTSAEYFSLKNVQVINLCKDYSYSSIGYYCSLLAEARKHKVVPSVKSILDLSSKSIYSLDAVHIDDTINKIFKKVDLEKNQIVLTAVFGQCEQAEFAPVARRIFETFPYPVLSITFKKLDQWRITRIRALSLQQLKPSQLEFFNQSLGHFLTKRWRAPKPKTHSRYDLAILYDPDEKLPPSNAKALKAMVKAGKQLGIEVELIEKKDYSRLAEYDALFIRSTTRINHYTYQFAKKAETEGMVVMDDPTSILRCTNKVYLAELLRANNIATPKTVIIGRNDLDAAEKALSYPMVLKLPEGAFSLGVFRVENREQYLVTAERLFENSELILAQEYLYTEYDWRIGVLNKRPIFACQYYMFRDHWQIVKHASDGNYKEGGAKTWAVAEVPKDVIDIAVKAASLIGDSLYGVDIKKSDKQVYVIEINDNPNIDAGVEDLYLGKGLYELIMGEFFRRMENKRR